MTRDGPFVLDIRKMDRPLVLPFDADYIMRSELTQKESELKLLQAQINPHMLYNTLDSVCYHIEQKCYSEASAYFPL